MRKNILIFCHGYATQFIDVNNQYTKLFDPEKYNVTVAYLVGKPDDSVRARHFAPEVIFINSPKQSTRGLKTFAIKQMLALHREKTFEIVICHRYKPTFIMLCVNRIKKIPQLIAVMHELKTMHGLMRKLTVLALAPNNMIFSGVSNAVRDDLRRDIWGIPHDRIITLYNMLDVAATEPALLDRDTARQRLKLSTDDFVFGTIGRLAIAKDQKSLVTAFAAIHAECPRAKLVIMGEGELKSALEAQIAELNLTGSVILTGYLDLAFQYAKAFDVFVLPSIKEAFGRVLLEAMVAKVPIIAAATHGIPEVVDHAGILIPASDPSSLAREMLRLYQESAEQLSARGELGYQRVIKELSLQRFKQVFWQLPVS